MFCSPRVDRLSLPSPGMRRIATSDLPTSSPSVQRIMVKQWRTKRSFFFFGWMGCLTELGHQAAAVLGECAKERHSRAAQALARGRRQLGREKTGCEFCFFCVVIFHLRHDWRVNRFSNNVVAALSYFFMFNFHWLFSGRAANSAQVRQRDEAAARRRSREKSRKRRTKKNKLIILIFVLFSLASVVVSRSLGWETTDFLVWFSQFFCFAFIN